MPTSTQRFVAVLLSWSRSDPGVSAVLRRDPDGAWDELTRVTGTEYLVRGLHPGRAHVFAAAPVLADGTLAPETEWEVHRVAPMADGATPALPGDPAGFAAAQDGGVLHFRWDPAEDGSTASYEIREGDSWEDGVLVGEGVQASPYSWPWWASGARIFHLKAVDRHGRHSQASACATLTIHSLEDHNASGAEDQGALGWPGTSTNLEDDGAGGLQLESVQGGWQDPPWDGPWSDLDFPVLVRYRPEGTYVTPAVDAGALESQRLEVDLGVAQPIDAIPWSEWTWPALGAERDAAGDLLPLGTPGHSSRNTWAGEPLDPVGFAVEVDTSPTAGGAWDGWCPFVPGTYTFRRVRLRVTLRGDGIRGVRLPGLVLQRWIRNRKQEGVIAVPGGVPVPVPFPVPFQRVPVVVPAMNGVYPGILGPKYEVTALSATGFEVEVFDGAGVSVACEVAWHAMGA